MKRFAIYAHYDREAQVKRYVTFLLERLREHAHRIDFVSTSALPEAELAKVRPLCGEVTLKENVGLDFGMWKDALARAGLAAGALDEFDELILVNSSVYGPVFPLGPIFRRMETTRCDFWGMTDNPELAWHLQSYFLAFKRPAFTSAPFRAFWQSVLPYRDKWQIIRSYEVGLTQFMRDAGFVGRAVAPDETLPFSRWQRFRDQDHLGNASCFHPTELLRAGMPFVKVELLRDNPGRVPLAPVYRAMKEAGYDLELIELERPRPARLERWSKRALEAFGGTGAARSPGGARST